MSELPLETAKESEQLQNLTIVLIIFFLIFISFLRFSVLKPLQATYMMKAPFGVRDAVIAPSISLD